MRRGQGFAEGRRAYREATMSCSTRLGFNERGRWEKLKQCRGWEAGGEALRLTRRLATRDQADAVDCGRDPSVKGCPFAEPGTRSAARGSFGGDKAVSRGKEIAAASI